jgi:hypothetical protein
VFLGSTFRFLYFTSGGAVKAIETITTAINAAITRTGLFMLVVIIE